MKMTQRIISAFLAAVMLLGLAPVMTARAAETVNGLQITPSASGDSGLVPTASRNDGAQNYYFYFGTPVYSALAREQGGFLRVEQTGSSVIAERYSDAFTLQSRKTIPMELPIFGGIYLCDDYNFLVFGQTNHEEDDNKEVVRVVRYSKNWERQAAASLCGANTTVPFDAGSLRFARYDDLLYIRTCHEMYTSPDGLNHQANLTMSVRISDMTVTDRHCEVSYEGMGYVSHSFNQFIQVDGRNLVAVDHGDAYPRSVVLIRSRKPAGLENFTSSSVSVDALPIAEVSGNYHYNATGVEVGGFEYSDTHYLIAGITCDQSGTADQSTAQKNVFITATPKDDFSQASTEIYYLTQYPEGAGADISNPHLVKVSGDRLCVLWTLGDQLYVRMIDGAGRPITDTVSMTGKLSDCPPIVADGKIVWYVCGEGRYQSAPVFYQLDWEALDAATEPSEPEPPETQPVEIVESGVCGENLTWTLDSAGTLRISGTGPMSVDGSPSSRWFAAWDQAENLILEEGVTAIGGTAFAHCANLASVTIADSVTDIGNYAFAYCTRLNSITIPKNVQTLAERVFAHCDALERIHVAEENRYFSADEQGVLFNKDKTSLLAAPGAMMEYSVPDGVRSIGKSAFEGCARLLSVEIPDSVTDIGFCAFSGCSGLSRLEIPDSVTNIGAYAFWDCTGLPAVTIPGSVTTLGWNAFEGCTNLTEVTIEEGVTAIGGYTFGNCKNLRDLHIPNTVTSIEMYAFHNCTGLTELKLPHSVTEIAEGAFRSCTNLTDVYYSGTEENRAEMNISAQDNEALETARWHYSSTGPEEAPDPSEPEPTEPVHSHVYVESMVPPTCTEEGYHSFRCSCGESYNGSTVPALGHDWDDGEITREPTEEEEGIRTFACSRCEETKTEPIPKLEHTHTYTAVVTPPTCEEPGYTTHTCTCGHSYTDNRVNAVGYHDWDDGTVTVAPTEDAEGQITFTCMACGETFTDVMDRLEHEHTYSAAVTPPTCEEAGYTTHTCTCGHSYTDNEIPALGHDWDDGVVTRRPTEEAEGVKTFTCETCEETRTESIPVLEPPPTDPVSPAILGAWTTDLVFAAADLGIDASDSVIRATFAFDEDGTATTTWQAVDLTALQMYFHQMFVNAYYAMAYGAGITDMNEIEAFCRESTGMSVTDYMSTIVTPEAMETAFTPPSTSGVYRLNQDWDGLYTDMAIMGVPSDPDVENSFVIGNNTMYLNAASYGKPEYTFVCTRAE